MPNTVLMERRKRWLQQFRDYSAAMWDLIPDKILNFQDSTYPADSVSAPALIAGSMAIDDTFFALIKEIKCRSWHWEGPNKNPIYDIFVVSELGYVPVRKYDDFHKAWPIWERAIRRALGIPRKEKLDS